MKALIKQIDGLSLVGKSDSNHWVPLDSAKTFGGAEAGTRPMEMILIALGGCTAMDVLSILKKMRENVLDFDLSLDAERAEGHPAVFTKIHLHYTIAGNGINPDNVSKAIDLSMDKYCSVSAMLKKSVQVTWDFEIKKED
ncbi:peroxiredoxin [candidate division KSB1 bacterium]|nr:OsmC family protein [candidate division KSB1 bacterium]RQW02245.1 MAG: peroxiredoxin [candidate division KSB1 bacterium]